MIGKKHTNEHRKTPSLVTFKDTRNSLIWKVIVPQNNQIVDEKKFPFITIYTWKNEKLEYLIFGNPNEHQWLLTSQKHTTRYYVPCDGSILWLPVKLFLPPHQQNGKLESEQALRASYQLTGKTETEEYINQYHRDAIS